MKYSPSEFSELSIRNGMKEWVETRQDRCDDPKIYRELPQEIKAELDNWISTHIIPSKRTYWKRSSYGLKADFKRDSGIYIYTGVFHGAMLRAGYQPVDPTTTNWHFKINIW